MKDEIEIRKARLRDVRFLYCLLETRDKGISISHKKMPSFAEHLLFMFKKPYRAWYIVTLEGRAIGQVYLTKQDEIGIHLLKSYQGKGFGLDAMALLRMRNPRRRYLANINPKNKPSILFFKKQGFKHIQNTYSLETEVL